MENEIIIEEYQVEKLLDEMEITLKDIVKVGFDEVSQAQMYFKGLSEAAYILTNKNYKWGFDGRNFYVCEEKNNDSIKLRVINKD